jgi:hypothetical protein
MKKSSIALFIASILLLTMSSGCRKDIYGCTDPSAANYAPNANVDNGSCRYTYYGNVIFWFDANNGVGTVNIAGQTGTITTYQTGGVPSCGNNGSATFSLPVGSYTYTASATNGFTWSGTAVVLANSCQAYQLH